MYNVQREREIDRYIEILIISDYSCVNMHILRDVKYVCACMYVYHAEEEQDFDTQLLLRQYNSLPGSCSNVHNIVQLGTRNALVKLGEAESLLDELLFPVIDLLLLPVALTKVLCKEIIQCNVPPKTASHICRQHKARRKRGSSVTSDLSSVRCCILRCLAVGRQKHDLKKKKCPIYAPFTQYLYTMDIQNHTQKKESYMNGFSYVVA